MTLTRRDFLKASAAIAAAFRVRVDALAKEGGLSVIWLQARGCTGCSVSLLNSIFYDTFDSLLINTLDLNFHSTLMAAPGNLARSAAESAYSKGNYVLVVEGAVPMGASGKYCYLWPGLTAAQGIKTYASKTPYVMAVGTCAAYGGVAAAPPNPTQAIDVQTLIGTTKKVIRIPGCPSHPDWIVGTIAYMLKYGAVPTLDAEGRPKMFFEKSVHDLCPFKGTTSATALGQFGCMKGLGCRGPETRADCPKRRWNTGAPNNYGTNWCIGARVPCHGCTSIKFSEVRPFFKTPK